MTIRGQTRGRGRGLAPPRVIEDRDVLGFANKTVANSGPPTIQTFSKLPPNLPTRGRGRGGGLPTSSRGGLPPSVRTGLPPSVRTGVPPSGPRGGPSIPRGRGGGGYSDTYRPTYGRPSSPSPPTPRYPRGRDRERSGSDEWAGYSEKQRERDREENTWNKHGHGSSDSYRPAAPRSVRRYSPSQPTMQDSWSPRSDDRFYDHAGPSTAQPLGTSSSNNPPQHIIFSSPSLPPALPSQPTSLRPPTSGASSRQPSPAVPSRPTNTSQAFATTSDKGKGKAVPPQIPEPPPPEIKKMSFKPINPNAPKPKGKEKQIEDVPVQVRVKAEPEPDPSPQHNPAILSDTGTRQGKKVEEIDVKPSIKELERDEIVHVGGEGIRRSGTFAFTKAELPDCWAKNPTERSKARMAFRKTQRDAMIAQGKKIGGTHWRDDGVAFDWTLPLPIPNPDHQSTTGTQAVVADHGERSGPTGVAGAYAEAIFTAPTASTSPSTLTAAPAPASAARPAPLTAASSSTSATFGQAQSRADAKNNTNSTAEAGPSRTTQQTTIDTPQTNAPKSSTAIKPTNSTNTNPVSVPKTPSKSAERLVVLTPSSLAASTSVSASTRTDASTSARTDASARTDDSTRSERRQIPYPPQFDTLQKRKQNFVDFDRWKIELQEMFCQRDESGNPTRGCTFKHNADGHSTMGVTIFSLEKARQIAKNDPSTWKNTEFTFCELFDYPATLSGPGRPSVAQPMKEWVDKIVAVVSKPDQQGKPTRWVKSIRRDTCKDLLVLSRDKTSQEMEEYEGPKIIHDDEFVRGLKRDEQPYQKGMKPPPLLKKAKELKSVLANGEPLTNKQKQKLEKQEKKRAREEAASENGSNSVVEISPAKSTSNSERPSKKNKNKHGEGSPSKSASGSNSVYVVSGNPSIDSEAKAGSSSTSAIANPSIPATIPALPYELSPNPTTTQDRTSPKLEGLNTSLRQKVSEIEKWTKLSTEFPDLKLALNTQIEKTREEIFGLYDDIAAEKVKLGAVA
ncbi:hypothetical protein I302_104377 [Kwoniella bestiolae CBS 10118]|uniref:Uncharacterized protein n=1 Tax=Kwoniella bestiolae CBS 10118 TaxID=1296100 RepID=A0A1B9GB38_9TREE|nr:hypothetical protein I302_03085 [Kwoniella bestiolae CBS 10118]OCF28233.1 hypothetical protein I302_03085 [Kwoniella bestiolae CBS 10118]